MSKSLVFVLSVLLSFSVYAKKHHRQPIPTVPAYGNDFNQNNNNNNNNRSQGKSDDGGLVDAIRSQRRVDFIEASNMRVTELLPDDTQGLPHQKFNVELSDGSTLTIISNLDMCPHIPVQVGDQVGAGGQFIPTGHGTGILHWVHRDPQQRRPDGYVELGGHVYCK